MRKSWLMRYDLNDGLEYILHISKGGVIYQMRLGKRGHDNWNDAGVNWEKANEVGSFHQHPCDLLAAYHVTTKHQCCYPN